MINPSRKMNLNFENGGRRGGGGRLDMGGVIKQDE